MPPDTEPMSIEEVVEELPAILRARQRGISHLRAIIDSWDDLNAAGLRESIEMALDRLENPW